MAKKNRAAVSLGRKGGKARAKALTPKQASEIGKKAANARWAKAKSES
jgi:general stress protein YciG